MDKYLRPEKLDIDPADSSPSKARGHWNKTFDNFLTSSEEIGQSAKDEKIKLKLWYT